MYILNQKKVENYMLVGETSNIHVLINNIIDFQKRLKHRIEVNKHI